MKEIANLKNFREDEKWSQLMIIVIFVTAVIGEVNVWIVNKDLHFFWQESKRTFLSFNFRVVFDKLTYVFIFFPHPEQGPETLFKST